MRAKAAMRPYHRAPRTLSPPGGEGRVREEMVNRPGVACSNAANVDVLK